MSNLKRFIAGLSLALIVAGCGTEENIEDRNQGTTTNVAVNDSGWETLEVVSNRPIIAELEQTVSETPERDHILDEIKNGDDFKQGLFGEPSDELAEEMTVQQVEGPAVVSLIDKIYGGNGGFDDEGVIFFENKTRGAEQSGIWVGVKKPDERLTELMSELQSQVDAGKIKAEFIYVYYTPFTELDNRQFTNEVVAATKKYFEKRGSLSVGVNTKGVATVSHNFLTKEQQEDIQSQFPDRTVIFEQEGRMIPKEGEADTTYPTEAYTTEYNQEGSYVITVGEESMLVVDASPEDYGDSGGENEYYSAIRYSFPDVLEKLKVGQRVKVEASGPIMESYPAQGTASYVEVLPEYKPEGASLSESQVISKTIAMLEDELKQSFLIVRKLAFNADERVWDVSVRINEEEIDVEVKDQ